jgi:O-antigen ligase
VRSNLISSLLLFGTVALAPLPFGSTDPAAIAVWCIILGVSLFFLSTRRLRRPHFVLLSGLAVIVLAYAFVLHEQLSTHPFIASPHPLWQKASAARGVQLDSVASIARNQPYFAIGAPLSAILVLICSLIVCADRIRARQVVKVVAWSGAAYAAFGIVALLLDPTKTLWRESAYPNFLTATFVNRNTAAAYFGSCSVIWLLITSEPVRSSIRDRGNKWTAKPREMIRQFGGAIVWPASMLLLCLVAMFMTGSRGGVMTSLFALIVAFFGFFHRHFGRLKSWLIAVVVLCSITLLILQIIGIGVSSRLESQGLADEGRLAVYRSTVRMIADRPWFGSGIGTFAWNFPAYRSTELPISNTWDRAHDTLLEIAAEGGLPLAGVIVASWVIALAVLIRGMRVRNRDLMLPVAAFSVAILGLLHSLVDFSLQIPAYAILVFALLGAGLAQSFATDQANKR